MKKLTKSDIELVLFSAADSEIVKPSVIATLLVAYDKDIIKPVTKCLEDLLRHRKKHTNEFIERRLNYMYCVYDELFKI